MLEKAILSLIVFFFFILAHLAVIYFGHITTHRMRTLKIVYALFLGIYTLLAFTVPGDLISEGIEEINALGTFVAYLNGAALYTLCFMFYGTMYYCVDRSISVRIAIELDNAPEKKLTLPALQAQYRQDQLLSMRLKDMVYGGYAEIDGDVYRLLPKGSFLAKINKLGRKILHSPPGY